MYRKGDIFIFSAEICYVLQYISVFFYDKAPLVYFLDAEGKVTHTTTHPADGFGVCVFMVYGCVIMIEIVKPVVIN